MLSLQDRLILAEDEFFAALAEGDAALSTFNERWEKLVEDLNEAADSIGLDVETSQLAHTTALRLITLADTSIELYANYNTITSQLMGQIDELMSELTLSDVSRDFRGRTKRRRDQTYSGSRSRSRSASPSVVYHKKRRLATLNPLSPTSCSHHDPSSMPSPLTSSPQISVPSYPTPNPPTPIDHSRHHNVGKRRFSDTDTLLTCHPAKKRRVGPRLHAVSDSFQLKSAANPTSEARVGECRQPGMVPGFVDPSEENVLAAFHRSPRPGNPHVGDGINVLSMDLNATYNRDNDLGLDTRHMNASDSELDAILESLLGTGSTLANLPALSPTTPPLLTPDLSPYLPAVSSVGSSVEDLLEGTLGPALSVSHKANLCSLNPSLHIADDLAVALSGSYDLQPLIGQTSNMDRFISDVSITPSFASDVTQHAIFSTDGLGAFCGSPYRSLSALSAPQSPSPVASSGSDNFFEVALSDLFAVSPSI
ncbi:hypothetical protein C8Q73DRAFT_663973 [Cubamyces lactineus]|nr:hypothetical protein C8Q73DRAFT_663973 [Cubamyces lactineus]